MSAIYFIVVTAFVRQHATYCLILIYNDHSYLGICTGYLELLLRRGVKPFVVFDGFPLPAKRNEQEERKR